MGPSKKSRNNRTQLKKSPSKLRPSQDNGDHNGITTTTSNHNNNQRTVNWRHMILTFSIGILMACCALLVVDNVGIVLCGKEELRTLMATTPSSIPSTVSSTAQTQPQHPEEIITTSIDEQERKKFWRFVIPKKKKSNISKEQIIDTVTLSPSTTTHHHYTPMCRNIALLLKTSTRFVPLPYYSSKLPYRKQQSSVVESNSDDKAHTDHHHHHHHHSSQRSKHDPQRHVLKRAVDTAATFFSKFKKGRNNTKSKFTQPNTTILQYEQLQPITPLQLELATTLATKVRRAVNDPHFEARVRAVSWGGPDGPEWWELHSKKRNKEDGDGVRLLTAYLRIMLWPKDLKTIFPFGLCKPHTCDAEFALTHTLEYREKFKPWFMTPLAIHENRNGWIFVRGHSPTTTTATTTTTTTTHNNQSSNSNNIISPGPTVIFLRPGLHKVKDGTAYTRALIHTLEMAVTDSLQRSGGILGKYNIVLDSTDFKLENIGGMHCMPNVKAVFTFMMDHFPDRLGHMYLTNLGRAAQLFLKMVSPFLAKEVKEKIHIVPNTVKERVEMLLPVLGREYIPHWLGGEDTFEFDKDEYYKMAYMMTEEEGAMYKTTMPYHA